MDRPTGPLLLAAALAAAVGIGAGCGADDDDGSEADADATAAFCAEAPDIIDGLATIEVLAPGANRGELENAHGIVQSELGGVTPPTGTPEADALGPAIDDLLALSPQDLDTPEGEKALATAREDVEAFDAAEC